MIWAILLLLSLFQGIVFFGHWIIYKGLVYFLHLQNSSYLPAIKWSLLGLSVSFTLATILTQKFIGALLDWFYTATAVWLGTVLWLSVVITGGWILTLLLPSLKTILPFGIIVIMLGLLISVYGVWNSFHPQITSYTVELPNLPDQWNNKKLALISDTHFGNVRGAGSAKKFAALIQAQQPQAVLVPGDFYDGPPTNYQTAADIFGQIKTPKGIYFSTGNHEEFHQDSSEYLNALKKSGIKILYNQMVTLDGLQIIGVTYKDSNNAGTLEQMLKQINFEKNLPSILLKHSPQALAGAAQAGVNLEVSGHTHKGQMWPLSLITKLMFKGYDYGMKNFSDMVQITTSGAGTWGPPQRIGSRAEIVIITLVKK